MSMICYVLQLAPLEVAALRRDPAAVAGMTQMAASASTNAVGLGAGDVLVLTRPDVAVRAPRLFGRLPRPFRKHEPAMGAAHIHPRQVLDLHKSWHVLHYLLTGHVETGRPPANALLAGQELGEDMGYGPARLHDPAATADFDRFLAPLTVEQLRSRIDMERMSALGIYCCDAADAEGSALDVHEDVARYFPRLKAFVADAARDGNGMLVWLS